MRSVGARVERLEAELGREAEERLRAEVAAERTAAMSGLESGTEEGVRAAWPLLLKHTARFATGDRRGSFITADRFAGILRGQVGIWLRFAAGEASRGEAAEAVRHEEGAAWFAFCGAVEGALPADLSRLAAGERREWERAVESLRRDAANAPTPEAASSEIDLCALLDKACPEWRLCDEGDEDGDGR